MYIHCCLKTEERSIQVEQKIKMDRNGAKTKESQQVQVLLALFDRSIDRKILPSPSDKKDHGGQSLFWNGFPSFSSSVKETTLHATGALELNVYFLFIDKKLRVLGCLSSLWWMVRWFIRSIILSRRRNRDTTTSWELKLLVLEVNQWEFCCWVSDHIYPVRLL